MVWRHPWRIRRDSVQGHDSSRVGRRESRVCSDPNDPKNTWLPGSSHLPGNEAEDRNIYLAVWAVAANFRCADKVDGVALVAAQDNERIMALAWALAANTAVMDQFWRQFGPPPDAVYVPNLSSQPGYAALCSDGTTSDAGGIQGACSWHGGVAG